MSSFSGTKKIAIFPGLVLAAIGLAQIGSSIITARSSPDSDLLRQWKASQYVRARIDPYPVAFAALQAHYGILAPKGPVHLRETQIYAVPKSGPDPATNPELGAPEATYPPTSYFVFAGTMSHFQASSVRIAWFALNLVLLPLIVRELFLLVEPGLLKFGPSAFGELSWLVAGLIAALVLAWPAVAYCFEREQFSLFILFLVLLAARLQSTRPVLAGLVWAVALLKPSMSLPYLLLPLAERRWKVLATTTTVQASLLLASAVQLRQAPRTLVQQWLAVAAYIRGGMYTVQEVINGLHLDGTLIGVLIPLGVVGLAFLVIRRLPGVRALAFLCFISAVWMYHGIYDFAVLVVPAALLVPDLFSISTRRQTMSWILSAGAFLAIGVALVPSIHNGDNATFHVLRWLGRLSLVIAMLIASKRDGTEAGRAELSLAA
jgi:hypothetical protein